MRLSQLDNSTLEQNFFQAVKTERKIMHLVLLYIQEISRRELYLGKSFSTLFEYLTEDAGYSESSAQRRIEAVRLIGELPSVATKLETGELNLSQICEIQSAVKTAEKIHQKKVDVATKANLVEQIVNCMLLQSSKKKKAASISVTQQICANALNIPILKKQKVKAQKDGSRRMEFTFTEEQFKKFEEVRNLLAHKNLQNKRTQNVADVLETVFDQILKPVKLTAKDESSVMTSSIEKKTSAETIYSTTRETAPAIGCIITWKSQTPKRKLAILHQDQCCQYEDYATGRICGSTFNLEIDHIIPRKAGGSNDPGNLRVLCRNHNQYRERAQALKRNLI